MAKVERRAVIKTIGVMSLGSFLPEQGKKSFENEKSTEKIREIKTDILVVGGGTAGVIAAIQAARAGCSTVLLENGSQPGGTITTGGVTFPGLFYAWGRQIISGIGWELVTETVNMNDDVLPDFSVPMGNEHWKHQVRINGYLYALLAEEKCIDAGVKIRYYETPVSTSFKDNKWEVETIGKGTHTKIICNQLIDCTGNALVTSMSGYKVLREPETQPGTLMFRLGGYNYGSLDLKKTEDLYNSELKKGEMNREDFLDIKALLRSSGDNVQHISGADSTTSESHTMTNIKGRSSLLKMLRFLRKLPGCENTHIETMQPETAVRETYRIDGVYKITQDDYTSGRVFDDSVSYSFYPIDLHYKEGVNPKHLSEGIIATVPLRALVPVNSRNFLVAGRCVSSDRLANSALRVQASCMAMGQAAGATAALASVQNISPLEVSVSEIKKLIEKHGGIVPN